MVRSNPDAKTKCVVYHHRFEDPDDPDSRYEVGADLGMGYEFAIDEADIDLYDVFDDAYIRQGAIGLRSKEFESQADAAGIAYNAWEDGAAHDPTVTRSMAVGDIIIVNGDAFFVDTVGFQYVDVPVDPADQWGDDE